MLDGESVSVLEYRSMAISVVGRETACLISAPRFSISLIFASVTFSASFVSSFKVFSRGASLNGGLYFTLMYLWPEDHTRLFPHTASAY